MPILKYNSLFLDFILFMFCLKQLVIISLLSISKSKRLLLREMCYFRLNLGYKFMTVYTKMSQGIGIKITAK